MAACDNPFKSRSCAAAVYCAPVMLAALFYAVAAPADVIYKTVNDSGVVSYSDTPPADEMAVDTLVIDVETPEPSESAQAQLDAMRETTDRMVADRQQREQHRAELRQLQAAANPQPQVIEYVEPARYGGTYPVYYPYPINRPGHRPGGGYRPRPGHPIARPPLRPTPSPHPAQLPANILSPGHDYPASLVRRGYSPEVRAAFER